jgi:hypothetical protein
MHMSNLFALKDVKTGRTEHIELTSGKVYSDPGGLHFVREMIPTEYLLGDKGQPVRDPSGAIIHSTAVSDAAAVHDRQKMADLYGHNVRCDVHGEDGRLVKMDLGVSDVHTAATLSNYAAGYHLAEGIADVASPVMMVPNQQDVYYTWNSANDFQRKIPNASAPGANIAEVNPTLAPSTYSTVQYALGGFIPTEVMTNADAPLRPFAKMSQMIVDALRLEREIRVATQLQTSGNWNSNLVTTIAAGAQWNGGAASDPLSVLHHAIEQSYLPVTGILWSELVEHDFVRNPSIQKYFTHKDRIDGVPDATKLASILRLPSIYTAQMKYVTGGVLSYVWGNHVVLLHEPKEKPPTSQMEVATAMTMRWNGGTAPDGALTAGMLVRTYWDPKRGGRGGTQLVCLHNDAEQMTSGLVGGLLLNCHQ